MLTINIDGAARGNPGPAGIGVVAKKDGKIVFKIKKYIGKTTNNVAEYNALITAVEHCLKLNFLEILVYSDSELIVKQVTGKYEVKDKKLLHLHKKVVKLTEKLKNFKIVHTKRENNMEADKLANEAIDEVMKK